jgi:hypothetical protein
MNRAARIASQIAAASQARRRRVAAAARAPSLTRRSRSPRPRRPPPTLCAATRWVCALQCSARAHTQPADAPAAPQPPVKVAVTGAAGNIGYALVFMLAQGRMLGPHQKIDLRLLEMCALQHAAAPRRAAPRRAAADDRRPARACVCVRAVRRC